MEKRAFEKMKHPLNVLIQFFLLIVPLSAAMKEQYRIILQANESAPFWIDKKGLCEGMGCEIIQSISQEMGISTKIEFRPLKRLIADTMNNDLGNPLFYMNNQSFVAIVPIAVTYSAFFSYIPHVEECRNARHSKECSVKYIGALNGTISDPASLMQFGEFEESYTHESLFKKLQKKRLDTVLELDLVGVKTIHSLFPNEIQNFDVQMLPQTASPVAIMIDSSTPDAIKIGHLYQEGLHRIIKNGTYRKILQKYYGKYPVPVNFYHDLLKYESLYSTDLGGNGL